MGRVREAEICLVARLGCLTETGEIMKTIVGVCQEELLQRVTWQFEIVDLAGASAVRCWKTGPELPRTPESSDAKRAGVRPALIA
jgi:hypothetical protein